MANWGHINDFAVRSKQSKHPLIRYESRRHPGFFYDFQFAYEPRGGNGIQYYRWSKCREILRRRNLAQQGAAAAAAQQQQPFIPRITVSLGTIIVDPDYPTAAHFCNPNQRSHSTSRHGDSRRQTRHPNNWKTTSTSVSRRAERHRP